MQKIACLKIFVGKFLQGVNKTNDEPIFYNNQ